MGLKDAILQVMDRHVLRCVVNDFELTGADRRSVGSMRECVAQSHVATPEFLLEHLSETLDKLAAQLENTCRGCTREVDTRHRGVREV